MDELGFGTGRLVLRDRQQRLDDAVREADDPDAHVLFAHDEHSPAVRGPDRGRLDPWSDRAHSRPNSASNASTIDPTTIESFDLSRAAWDPTALGVAGTAAGG